MSDRVDPATSADACPAPCARGHACGVAWIIAAFAAALALAAAGLTPPGAGTVALRLGPVALVFAPRDASDKAARVALTIGGEQRAAGLAAGAAP